MRGSELAAGHGCLLFPPGVSDGTTPVKASLRENLQSAGLDIALRCGALGWPLGGARSGRGTKGQKLSINPA